MGGDDAALDRRARHRVQYESHGSRVRRAPLPTGEPRRRRRARDRLTTHDEAHFEHLVQLAIDELPDDIRAEIANVAVVVEDEPPPGERLLGLYRGVPLTKRGLGYSGALPDKITIYRGPLERLYGADPDRLRREVAHVVRHEIAHYFGISDQRLIDIDRY